MEWWLGIRRDSGTVKLSQLIAVVDSLTQDAFTL